LHGVDNHLDTKEIEEIVECDGMNKKRWRKRKRKEKRKKTTRGSSLVGGQA